MGSMELVKSMIRASQSVIQAAHLCMYKFLSNLKNPVLLVRKPETQEASNGIKEHYADGNSVSIWTEGRCISFHFILSL